MEKQHISGGKAFYSAEPANRKSVLFRQVSYSLAILLAVCSGFVLSSCAGQNTPAVGSEAGVPSDSFEHGAWEALLQAHVSENGWVDYDAMAKDRPALDAYLEQLSKAKVQSWPDRKEQLAFWINTYNAFAVASALDQVNSKAVGVKEVPGFFDLQKHPVAGEQLTLDEIERRGRDLKDPRIHFAIVCASTSCPRLQRFAYRGRSLDEQLDRAARDFVADTQRGLRFDAKENRVYLSSIFKWYAGDFTGNTGAASEWFARANAVLSGQKVVDFAMRYTPADITRQIEQKRPKVSFMDYDWSWNSRKNHPESVKEISK